jgi:hypothetical protein
MRDKLLKLRHPKSIRRESKGTKYLHEGHVRQESTEDETDEIE